MGTPHHQKNLMANFGNVGTKNKIGKNYKFENCQKLGKFAKFSKP
jgi:hypothetical protein